MQRRAILAMVWLVGCGGVDPQEALSAAPVPGEIIQPDLGQAGELNARSANLGRLFSTQDGRCYVRVPPAEPLPPGAMGDTLVVPCPAEMKHPSFAACGFGVVSRVDDGACVCEPWQGDPPAPSRAKRLTRVARRSTACAIRTRR